MSEFTVEETPEPTSGKFNFDGLPGNWIIRDGCLVVARQMRTGPGPFDVRIDATVLPVDALLAILGRG